MLAGLFTRREMVAIVRNIGCGTTWTVGVVGSVAALLMYFEVVLKLCNYETPAVGQKEKQERLHRRRSSN